MADALEGLLGHLATVPNKTRADKLEALRSATLRFLELSLAWRESVPLSPVEVAPAAGAATGTGPGAALYPLPMIQDRVLGALLRVDGIPREAWMRSSRASDRAACILAHSGGVALSALVAWLPVRGAEGEIPAELLELHGWSIAQEARGRLMPEAAAEARTEAAVDAARARARADAADGLNQSVW